MISQDNFPHSINKEEATFVLGRGVQKERASWCLSLRLVLIRQELEVWQSVCSVRWREGIGRTWHEEKYGTLTR